MSHTSDKLIDAIERFLVRHNLSAVTFGRDVLNDPHFVRDVRGEDRARPRRVWPETEAKVREFMERYDAEQAPLSSGSPDNLSRAALVDAAQAVRGQA